jgi:hypothetical protein
MRLRHATGIALVLLAADGLGRPALAEGAGKKVLVVTVTKGFRHDSIPTAERVVGELARESGAFTVSYARTDAELAAAASPQALQGLDGILLANTTGDLPFPDPEAFVQWVEHGRALIGFHSASDTFHGFRPFVETLGGEFDYHRQQAKVVPRLDDPAHPATRDWPKDLEIFDEIYLFKSFERERVHMLLSLGRHPNSGEPGHYPLAWTRAAGQGRVFYTALGHREDVVEAAWFRKHLLGGTLWALGLAD